jgi:hypothetical protein
MQDIENRASYSPYRVLFSKILVPPLAKPTRKWYTDYNKKAELGPASEGKLKFLPGVSGPGKGCRNLGSFIELFDVCIVFSGVYMLYSAVTGKGSFYKTDNIKKGLEEKYKKLIRLLCAVGGVLAAAQGSLDYFKIQPFATILFFLLCAVIVAFCVVSAHYASGKSEDGHL